jgi:predicted AAA+ superfamily ATPase
MKDSGMTEIIKKLEKHNPWSGKTPKAIGWPRKSYLDQIRPMMGNRLIKVILGQRRAGKSTLLRQIMAEMLENGTPPKQILYLNKEMVDFDGVRTYQDLSQLIAAVRKTLKIKKKMILFLDEVQDIEGWEKLVNSLSQDPRDLYELVISGSNSTMLSGELASRLSGRYITLEVMPFSFSEYCGALGQSSNKQSYLAYLQSGGLPELFHLPEEEVKRHYISSLRDTILLKDIVEHYRIKDAELLSRVFAFLTRQYWQPFFSQLGCKSSEKRNKDES